MENLEEMSIAELEALNQELEEKRQGIRAMQAQVQKAVTKKIVEAQAARVLEKMSEAEREELKKILGA